jgi:uncharacterized membrane protein (UPF0127 family)
MRRLDRLASRAVGDGLVVHEATTPIARLVGLTLLRELPPGHALRIPRCRSVHTFGMRFQIDILFLDDGGTVLRVEHAVLPRRVVFCRGATAVIEANAGEGRRFSPPRPPAARAGASGR